MGLAFRRSRPLRPVTVDLRVGTRRSALALAQAEWVRARIESSHRTARVDLVPLVTSGDRNRRDARRDDFTDAIDSALLRRDVDIAVHSAKDLPSEGRAGLVVAAYPRREDPRDCLVVRGEESLRALPRGARVGSSSARRRAQLLRRRPDLDVVELRGNVDTRIERVRESQLDGVVLAYAGLRRLNRQAEARQVFTTRQMLPAPAQGALAVATRRQDRTTTHLLRPLDDPATRACVTAERAFVASMGGDCTVPLAAYADLRHSELLLRAEVYSRDGATRLAVALGAAPGNPRALGNRAARELKRRGATSLWTEMG